MHILHDFFFRKSTCFRDSAHNTSFSISYNADLLVKDFSALFKKQNKQQKQLYCYFTFFEMDFHWTWSSWSASCSCVLSALKGWHSIVF
jgi:hypothetical protein